MKKRIFTIAIGFFLVLVTMFLLIGAFLLNRQGNGHNNVGQMKVALNEVHQLGRLFEDEEWNEAYSHLEETIDIQEKSDSWLVLILPLILYSLSMAALLFYIYRKMIVPFENLEQYAEELARGNFDVGLQYERENYFGEFTWAFDNMRKEIVAARKRETDAIENNKLIISSLSHDIKTPIASI